MGTYITYYPASDNNLRLGNSLWPELIKCLKYADEKAFTHLINLPDRGILDEDQIGQLSEAFQIHKESIYDWFYNLPEDYPFEESLDKALWSLVNSIIEMDETTPGLIQINLSQDYTEVRK